MPLTDQIRNSIRVLDPQPTHWLFKALRRIHGIYFTAIAAEALVMVSLYWLLTYPGESKQVYQAGTIVFMCIGGPLYEVLFLRQRGALTAVHTRLHQLIAKLEQNARVVRVVLFNE